MQTTNFLAIQTCIVCKRDLTDKVFTRKIDPKRPWLKIAYKDYPLCEDYGEQHISFTKV